MSFVLYNIVHALLCYVFPTAAVCVCPARCCVGDKQECNQSVRGCPEEIVTVSVYHTIIVVDTGSHEPVSVSGKTSLDEFDGLRSILQCFPSKLLFNCCKWVLATIFCIYDLPESCAQKISYYSIIFCFNF